MYRSVPSERRSAIAPEHHDPGWTPGAHRMDTFRIHGWPVGDLPHLDMAVVATTIGSPAPRNDGSAPLTVVGSEAEPDPVVFEAE